jgi:hypothetical protein
MRSCVSREELLLSPMNERLQAQLKGINQLIKRNSFARLLFIFILQQFLSNVLEPIDALLFRFPRDMISN